MSNSLRDELLRAGLISEKQVRDAESRSRPQTKRESARRPRPPSPHAGPPAPAKPKKAPTAVTTSSSSRPAEHRTAARPQSPAPLDTAAASPPARAAATGASDTTETRSKEQEQKAKRATRARLRALLARHRRNDPAGEISHKFVIGNQIRGVYVNDAQHRALAEGSLAIVYFERRAHVVTAEVATGVRTLSPHTFIHIAHAEEPTRSDDAYAGYDVPDDLIW